MKGTVSLPCTWTESVSKLLFHSPAHRKIQCEDYDFTHLYRRLTSTSFVNPIPPQYCKQASVNSLDKRPTFSLHIDANMVTSCPWIMLPVKYIGPIFYNLLHSFSVSHAWYNINTCKILTIQLKPLTNHILTSRPMN